VPHLDTHSAHSSSAQVLKEAAVTSCLEEGREREAYLWKMNLCVVWFIILALYWLSILRKFCWVLFPLRVSQDKCLCTLVIVFLSVILSMLLLSSK
jgi:hypothetical protein